MIETPHTCRTHGSSSASTSYLYRNDCAFRLVDFFYFLEKWGVSNHSDMHVILVHWTNSSIHTDFPLRLLILELEFLSSCNLCFHRDIVHSSRPMTDRTLMNLLDLRKRPQPPPPSPFSSSQICMPQASALLRTWKYAPQCEYDPTFLLVVGPSILHPTLKLKHKRVSPYLLNWLCVFQWWSSRNFALNLF